MHSATLRTLKAIISGEINSKNDRGFKPVENPEVEETFRRIMAKITQLQESADAEHRERLAVIVEVDALIQAQFWQALQGLNVKDMGPRFAKFVEAYSPSLFGMLL